jgi:hypothetical protein
MKIPFVYFVDDDYETGERVYQILESIVLPEDWSDDQIVELIDKMNRNGLWYDVKLNAELDTDTGQVTLLSLKNG